MTVTGTRTVIIAHPDVSAANSLVGMLSEAGYRSPLLVSDTESAVSAALEQRPDIVLLDDSLLGEEMSTIGVLAEATEGGVVVLGAPSDNPSRSLQALAVGAKGYLSTSEEPVQFAAFLDMIAHGALVVSNGPARVVAKPAETQAYEPFDILASATLSEEAAARTEAIAPPASPTMGEPAISVLIGYPHRLTSEGLSRILTEAGHHVLKQVTTADELFKAARDVKPDIILVDTNMLENRMQKVREIVESHDGIVVLLSNSQGDSNLPIDAIQAGARGSLSVDDLADSFLSSLRLLMEGGIVLSSRSSNELASRIRTGYARESPSPLTGRERELAILVGHGASNREIANHLSLSEHTIKVHLANILAKLNLRNRQQIAVYAAQRGLLEDIPVEDQPS